VLLFALGCRTPPVAIEIAQLSPLEGNRAPLPAGDHPETLEVVSGGEGGLWWAHGRGYVRAAPEVVWAAAMVPEVGVDRREVDEWTVTEDPRGTLDASYRVDNVVHDVLTVSYELWWRHERQDADGSAPRLVTRWDKTDGTTFIDILSGSMELIAVAGEPDLVEVSLIEHLDAALRDDETIASYLRDLHASLVAAAHGEPLPTW
jgi:hypothetical protein